MNVAEALKKIGNAIEIALNEDEDAMTWDQENAIKKMIVQVSHLEEFFPDENELENNVWYDMFEEHRKIPYEKQIEMIVTFVDMLDEECGISVDIDTSELS